jgi:hypothetical protein
MVEKGHIPREGESCVGQRWGAAPDYQIDLLTGCWNWAKAPHPNGYPAPTNLGKPHRVYYQLANGPLSSDIHVHHKCANTLCVNPAHLEALDPTSHFWLHHVEDAGRDWDLIRSVRADYATGEFSQRGLAAKYDIPQRTVCDWVSRGAWSLDRVERAPTTRTCVRCSQSFVPSRVDHVYCGHDCKRLASQERRLAARHERQAA